MLEVDQVVCVVQQLVELETEGCQVVADAVEHDAELSLIVTVLQHCLLEKWTADQPKQAPAHIK
jgi:hypothetical protein